VGFAVSFAISMPLSIMIASRVRSAHRRLEMSAMMLLVELARHRQTIHSARCEFSLEQHPEGWRIKQK
jgi:hypothetical protein